MPKPSDQEGTIYDVAREAGVSIGTVSRVFNNKGEVAARTRETVLRAARRVNYMPRLTARRIHIGVVVQEVKPIHELGYVGTVMCELSNHAARRGVTLEIVRLNDIETVYTRHLRGLIGVVFGEASGILRQVTHIPVLLINNVLEKGSFHSVATDHAQGVRMATEYLLERGHRRIVCLQIEGNEWGARAREQGYREAHAAAGVKVREELVATLEDRSIEQVFDPLLKHKPTAVLACGEDLSIAMADELRNRLKIRVPQDLSVISYEIPLVSALLSPPQTTVEQPWRTMARHAVDELVKAIQKKVREPVRMWLPNRLIERASVRDLS
ncbi:MAG: LacI family DNA-binding transcriptional regulator [Kiritimatiellae bacterium]|nr:LacI family DNA-binding transcriptional regulator [Kiritimatiellia bacterium]